MEDALDTLEAIETLEHFEDLDDYQEDIDGLQPDPLERELVDEAVEEVMEDGPGLVMEDGDVPKTMSPLGKIFTAQQNIAQIQFIIPRLGQGFSVKVTFRRNHKREEVEVVVVLEVVVMVVVITVVFIVCFFLFVCLFDFNVWLLFFIVVVLYYK